MVIDINEYFQNESSIFDFYCFLSPVEAYHAMFCQPVNQAHSELDKHWFNLDAAQK